MAAGNAGRSVSTIKFKTKVRQWADGGSYIEIKRALARGDCDLKPHTHTYYNSDLFPAMLNGAYRAIVGPRTERLDLDKLPQGVSIAPGFLATVTITLPESFK